MLAGIFTGFVISIEHLVMIIIGGASAAIISNRISKLKIQVNGRLTGIDKRLDELESEVEAELDAHRPDNDVTPD